MVKLWVRGRLMVQLGVRVRFMVKLGVRLRFVIKLGWSLVKLGLKVRLVKLDCVQAVDEAEVCGQAGDKCLARQAGFVLRL